MLDAGGSIGQILLKGDWRCFNSVCAGSKYDLTKSVRGRRSAALKESYLMSDRLEAAAVCEAHMIISDGESEEESDADMEAPYDGTNRTMS